MRSKLKSTYKQRNTFQAVFTKFGSFHNAQGKKEYTILVQNITLANRIVADHLWLSDITPFDGIELQRGNRVQFSAVTDKYVKPNISGQYAEDYLLRNIQDVIKL